MLLPALMRRGVLLLASLAVADQAILAALAALFSPNLAMRASWHRRQKCVPVDNCQNICCYYLGCQQVLVYHDTYTTRVMVFRNLCSISSQDKTRHATTLSQLSAFRLCVCAVLPIKPLSCATTCWEPAWH